MRIGIPAETKEGERRVVLEPEAVAVLVANGHTVRVQAGAGSAVGRSDADYYGAGAELVDTNRAWDCELVLRVKEMLPGDLARVQPGCTVFSFHQFPGEPQRVRALAGLAVTAIAFEMVRDVHGGFPLLAPMSRIAGRMAVDEGAARLGSRCREVVVLGAGHAGLAAAREAAALGMRVTVLARSQRSLEAVRAAGLQALPSTPENIERAVLCADLVVGAVFMAGQPTPKLLPRALVRRMKRGAMIVDISIDAGGIAETSRATTHAEPTFVAEGVLHYGVSNMPAAHPAEATAALSAAVLPYARQLAGRGIAAAVREAPGLRAGVLLWRGRMTHPDIAAEAGVPYTPLTESDLP
jgi:alanine dehydrogenase